MKPCRFVSVLDSNYNEISERLPLPEGGMVVEPNSPEWESGLRVVGIKGSVTMPITRTAPAPIWVGFWENEAGEPWHIRMRVDTSGVVFGESVVLQEGAEFS
jgi:hypothetical protein